MEWIKAILEANRKEDGTVDIDAVMNAVNAEFPENAVPKNVYNDQAEKLKTATSTIATLQKDNKDNEALQQEISDYKSKNEALEKQAAETAKQFSLKEALVKAGAKDIDYMIFKLGNVEVDAAGNVVDLENKIKSLKEATPDFFEGEQAKQPGAEGQKGYKPIDNKLKGNGPQTNFDLNAMSVDDINANWETIINQTKK